MVYLILIVLSLITIITLIIKNQEKFSKRFKVWICGEKFVEQCDSETFKQFLKESLGMLILVAIFSLLVPVLNVIVFSFWLFYDEIVDFIFEKIEKE